VGRALKFHHRERLKKNRRFHYGRDLASEPKFHGMAINTPKTCSCAVCCNARKTEGMTRAEKISIIDMVDYG